MVNRGKISVLGDYPHLGSPQARNHAVHSAVLRDAAQSLSKRDSERLPGLQGRKIAPFDRLRMRFCSLWHLWVITRSVRIGGDPCRVT